MSEESSPDAATFREVVAVFGSEAAFSDAIDALQAHGVDRARISVLDAYGVPRTVYE